MQTQTLLLTWKQLTLEGLASKAVETCTQYGIRILLALLFIAIGFKLTVFALKVMGKALKRQEVDPSVTGFLLSFSNIVLRILILLTAANGLGIRITSFLTVLGSAGVAIGLALQGSLSNLAGGLLILILKPFRVGDYIKTETNAIEGTVTAIDIFYTRLKSNDNQTIVIPNGTLSNSSIVNVTKAQYRRIDFTVDISYNSDIKKAKDVLQSVIMAESRIMTDMEYDVFVSALGESGVAMGIHVWVNTEEYWKVRWDLLEAVKYALDEAGIEIPYQTVDVNVKEHI